MGVGGQGISLVTPELALSVRSGITHLHVNLNGKFINSGPQGDAGLTGRKIIIDMSVAGAPKEVVRVLGEYPTMVDRSAAYICRQKPRPV